VTGRIEDYAMIGDCRTAALVGGDGSIDWLCLPRFDSGACFASLLGGPQNGYWAIRPTKKHASSRAYRGDSLILETLFTTATGTARIIDFMPPGTDDTTLVRMVEGLQGRVDLRTEIAIRFDYGLTIPWVNRIDRKTLRAVAGRHLVTIRTAIDLHGENLHSVGEFTVRKGECVPFVMAYSGSFQVLPIAIDADIALEETEKFWSGWSGICRIQGKWRNWIMRSLVTLKGLSYAPSGGIVAAVTTSLPEEIGGARNWDYRYCWLRDATFILLAFLNAGYTEEANVWQHWLMRVIAGAPEQIQTMYSVRGDRRLDEVELSHLAGYEGSRPVRIGNAAAGQLQLDIFGELTDVMAQASAGGLPRAPRRSEPDEGIWEIRGPARHFVHSKVMTWVAFDRTARAAGISPRERAHYQKMARDIHNEICAKGVDPERGCFVQAYGSPDMDASLLLLPLVGFLPASDKRIRATVREIEKRLMFKGLVLRYETASGVDGLPPGEGAFLACSFWLADNYRLMGRRKEALSLFSRLRRLANDVGLYAEEYDPRAKRMLGNFPQAFSHVALINTAIGLMTDDKRKPHGAKKTQIRHA